MRVFFPVHNAYTDNTSGAARSMRTIIEWLTEAGHECRVLCTARFDAKPPDSVEEHLASLGIEPQRTAPPRRLIRSGSAGRPILTFKLADVPVTMLLTRFNSIQNPDKDEYEQFCNLARHMLKDYQPDVVLSYGGHPVVQEVLRGAQARGAITVFSLRNFGYENASWFKFANYALTCSPFLSRYYSEKIGLISTGIPSPIDWSDVLAPEESRSFVTFVNPSLQKGAAVFARLADMLGSRRPDIPVLVVQSAADATSLNSIPGIDFSKYPQIMAAPPVPRPADFFELTRILVVPSVFHEPFGRVAAESMINGIPPVVSDRGALPDTVQDAGIVLSVPDWLTPQTIQIPDEDEVQEWFDAVCRLWDNPDEYRLISGRGREVADELYSEKSLKKRYLDYFTSLEPGHSPLV